MEDLLQDFGRDDVRDAAGNRARREQLISSLPGRLTVGEEMFIETVPRFTLPLLTYNLFLLVVLIVAVAALAL